MTLTAVDVFSGPGGMTTGLKDAGFRVIGAVDLDETSVATYRKNHPEVYVAANDIRKLDLTTFMEDLGLRRGDLALLAACPPCQGYSSIRTRNSKTAAADPRNDLVLEVLRASDALLPSIVMMENVQGLMGDPRLNRLVMGLDELGYDVGDGPVVLNAADYGVPQSRRRLVLIASRVGRIPPAERTHKRRKTVRMAIGKLPPPGKTGDVLHDLPERRSERVQRLIRAIPRDGGSRSDLPAELELDCHTGFDGFKDVYGRMTWDRPAPTITGGCFNPSKGRFLHPDQDRCISLREAALLQGFPADYFFSLARGKSGAAAMIGNALPPAFVEAHARQLVSALRSNRHD